jgi:hypothetical protein
MLPLFGWAARLGDLPAITATQAVIAEDPGIAKDRVRHDAPELQVE